jgi:hypothetical protein
MKKNENVLVTFQKRVRRSSDFKTKKHCHLPSIYRYPFITSELPKVYILDCPIVPHSLKMKLSICLCVFLSSWKATNAFLPSQARAFTLATTKPTTSSSLNADAEHENVSEFRKGQRQGSNASIEVRALSYFVLYPIHIYIYIALDTFTVVSFSIRLSYSPYSLIVH